MKKVIVLLAFLATWAIVCPAQSRREIFAISRGDSVALYLLAPPSSLEGFLVYRQGPLPTSEAYQPLTEVPVRPVIDPEQMLSLLGPDWDLVARLVESDDPFVALRRLRSNELTSRSLSFLSTRVAQVTGRWFCDPNAKRGKEYSYRVVFVNNDGKRLDSSTVRIALNDFVPPPPTNLKAVLGGNGINLTWDYPVWKGTPENAAIRFDVYRRVDKGQYDVLNAKPILRNDAAAKQYVDPLFSYRNEYTYTVTATDPLGRQSKPSTPVVFIPLDKVSPALPAGLQAQSSERSILLTWSMSLDLDAAGYYVHRSTGSKEDPTRLTKTLIKVDKPFYVDSTVKGYTQYFYSVSALDNANNESPRSNPLMAMTKDLTPPDPPLDVSFKLDRHYLKLSWKPSLSMDAIGYNIYRGEVLERQPLVNRALVRVTVFTDSGYQGRGLIPGRRFFISVTALDSARNESSRVTVSIAVPDDEAPAPPAMFRAENVDGRYVEIACSPSPSPDAALYEIYRSDERKNDVRLIQGPSAPFRYRDTTATKGSRYQYYSIAIDTAGNRSEKSTVESVLVRDFSPPPSPRNVSARVTQKGVEVSWERAVDFDLDGYVIYRSEIPGGSGTRVTQVPLKSLTFTDPDGKKDNYYLIRAIDTSGNESITNNAAQAR